MSGRCSETTREGNPCTRGAKTDGLCTQHYNMRHPQECPHQRLMGFFNECQGQCKIGGEWVQNCIADGDTISMLVCADCGRIVGDKKGNVCPWINNKKCSGHEYLLIEAPVRDGSVLELGKLKDEYDGGFNLGNKKNIHFQMCNVCGYI